MIHIATVHAFNDRWIDIQIRYLKRHIQKPFRLYAFLDTHPGVNSDVFYFWSLNARGGHTQKLNLLADIILRVAENPSDLLLFIDGDAFPIGDIVGFMEDKIEKFPLIAVQRLENNGDRQPHPSFCATTVGMWRTIDGDWSKGYHWKNSQGQMVSDVGGNLLKIVEERRIDWYPMLRSNRKNLHPLLFGIYSDVIYHHGAGFRPPLLRIDSPFFQKHKTDRAWVRLLNRIPDSRIGSIFKDLFHPLQREGNRIIRDNQVLSEQVYRTILADAHFYTEFL